MKRFADYLILGAMALLGLVLIMPCLLVFTCGHDGGPTVWNFVGAAWMIGLYFIGKKIGAWIER